VIDGLEDRIKETKGKIYLKTVPRLEGELFQIKTGISKPVDKRPQIPPGGCPADYKYRFPGRRRHD
jgi:hypothetical protein